MIAPDITRVAFSKTSTALGSLFRARRLSLPDGRAAGTLGASGAHNRSSIVQELHCREIVMCCMNEILEPKLLRNIDVYMIIYGDDDYDDGVAFDD